MVASSNLLKVNLGADMQTDKPCKDDLPCVVPVHRDAVTVSIYASMYCNRRHEKHSFLQYTVRNERCNLLSLPAAIGVLKIHQRAGKRVFWYDPNPYKSISPGFNAAWKYWGNYPRPVQVGIHPFAKGKLSSNSLTPNLSLTQTEVVRTTNTP